MEKYILAFLCLLLVVFSSCKAAEPMYLIYSGNSSFYKGEYQNSVSAYLQALEKKSFREWTLYNLGNTYYAMGEPKKASEKWLEVVEKKKIKNVNLRFSSFYNLGIFYYESGEYKKAYESFKKALLLKWGDPDSRINLEKSYRKLTAAKNAKYKNGDSSFDNDNSGDPSLILDYIKKEEIQIRESSRKQEKTAVTNDW